MNNKRKIIIWSLVGVVVLAGIGVLTWGLATGKFKFFAATLQTQGTETSVMKFSTPLPSSTKSLLSVNIVINNSAKSINSFSTVVTNNQNVTINNLDTSGLAGEFTGVNGWAVINPVDNSLTATYLGGGSAIGHDTEIATVSIPLDGSGSDVELGFDASQTSYVNLNEYYSELKFTNLTPRTFTWTVDHWVPTDVGTPTVTPTVTNTQPQGDTNTPTLTPTITQTSTITPTSPQNQGDTNTPTLTPTVTVTAGDCTGTLVGDIAHYDASGSVADGSGIDVGYADAGTTVGHCNVNGADLNWLLDPNNYGKSN